MFKSALSFLLLLFCSTLMAQLVEKTYLAIDKEVYSPKDTIWFKGYVFNEDNLISDESISFTVMILNEEGNKVNEGSWPVVKGLSPGNLVAPDEEGRYFLVAFSGKSLNFDPLFSFRRPFYVRSDIVNVISLSASTDQENYLPGQDIGVNLHATLSDKEVARGESFSYAFYEQGEVVKKGRARTDAQGDFTIRYPNPKNHGSLDLIVRSESEDVFEPVVYAVPIPLNLIEADLQFFPEGGTLIEGISSKVAFKCTASSGKPLDFTAVVEDEGGRVVDTIQSFYQGTGSFMLTPSALRLGARIISPAGIQGSFRLPEAQAQGATLALQFNEEGTPIAKVSLSESLIGTPYQLELKQHKRELYSLWLGRQSREFFELPTGRLDIGIAKLSLKDQSGQIVAERLFFADHQKQLQVQLSTDKKDYLPREKVELSLQVTDETGKPIKGNFTVSVVDATYQSNLNTDSPNLMAQILLNSELKGEIVTPNFYFSEDPKASKALDHVLLTHGWRRYEPLTSTDYEGLAGQLIQKKKKKQKLSNYDISVFSYSNYQEQLIKTDKEGRFAIDAKYFKYEGDSFLIASKAKKKEDKPNILIDPSIKKHLQGFKKSVQAYVKESVPPDFTVFLEKNKIRPDRFQQQLILNRVEVEGERRLVSQCEADLGALDDDWKQKNRGELDLSDTDDIVKLLQQVSDRVRGVGDQGFYKGGTRYPGRSNALLSYDRGLKRSIKVGVEKEPNLYWDLTYGVMVNCDALNSEYLGEALLDIDFANVEHIAVLDPIFDSDRGPNGYFRPGLIQINTIDDVVIFRPRIRSFFTHTLPHNIPAEFYSPKYETKKEREDPIPDLRTTIHWAHTVVTDKQGKAKVVYYNADRSNRMKITVEGMGRLQRFGFAQKEYFVLTPASSLGN